MIFEFYFCFDICSYIHIYISKLTAYPCSEGMLIGYDSIRMRGPLGDKELMEFYDWLGGGEVYRYQ